MADVHEPRVGLETRKQYVCALVLVPLLVLGS